MLQTKQLVKLNKGLKIAVLNFIGNSAREISLVLKYLENHRMLKFSEDII